MNSYYFWTPAVADNETIDDCHHRAQDRSDLTAGRAVMSSIQSPNDLVMQTWPEADTSGPAV